MKLEDHAALTVFLFPVYVIASHYGDIGNVVLTILIIVGILFLGRLLLGVFIICCDPKKYPEEVKVSQTNSPDTSPVDNAP